MSIDESRVQSLFFAALDRTSPAERGLYLDSACGADTELRQRVEQLLAAQPRVGDFLKAESPASTATLIVSDPVEEVGTVIGPYKLREVLGEGGMGTVYAAEQEKPVRRKVALKVIKPGMDTRDVIARFEAERQALALMDHPNIAKVLDAGTTAPSPPLSKGGPGGVALHGDVAVPGDQCAGGNGTRSVPATLTSVGRPYFVMELVRGIPITDYCDKVNLTPRDRLKLFIPVCQAVQHAHQKGIIHRDLKPSNVLVTLHDGVPVPKVIDFGVAKAINQRLTEHTVYTRVAQMVGTPMYMSPEQAELSGLDVDTRSDVYSLGVLLYELLAGATPFDKDTFSKAGYDEMRRMIREDEPPRPSQRVSTLEAKARSTVSGKRGIDERKLARLLHGELDWIVMKALEKNRQRRYESASAFAADIQRYLDDQPVEAGPPSAAYRLRKFARRNKTTLTTAIVVSSALVAGTALSLWQAVEATSARKLADDRLVLADERLKNEQRARTDADEQREHASANIQKALDAVDQMLMRVADERLADIPGAEPVRQELFQDALKFYDAFFEQAPDDPQLRISMAKAWSRVGSLYEHFGDSAKAQEGRQEAIRRWESLHAESPDDPRIQTALADVYREFGNTEHFIPNKIASAEAALQRAAALWLDLQCRFPDNIDYQWETSRTEFIRGYIYRATNRIALAECSFRNSADVQRRLWSREPVSGKRHGHLCNSLNFLAMVLAETQRDAEAEAVFSESVGRGEEMVASDPRSSSATRILVESAQNFGDFLNRRGRLAEAEKHYRRAVEAGQLLPRVNPRDFQNIFFLARTQVALANLLARDGRHSEALRVYRAAGDLTRPALFPPEKRRHWRNISRGADQGIVDSLEQLTRSGHVDEARPFCEELSRATGSGTVGLSSRLLAARAWEAIGEAQRGQQIFNEVVERFEERTAVNGNQADRASFASLIFDIGDADFHRGHYERALAMFDLALRTNPSESEALDHRGQIFLARGENDKALADLNEAVRHGPAYGGYTYGFRARAHFQLGHFDRAAADLAQSQSLWAIDPAEIAACSDKPFLRNYLNWFHQSFAATNSSSEARLCHAALLTELGQREMVPGDLSAIQADASAAPNVLYQAALVALRTGDQSRYREFCRLLAARDRKSLDARQCGYIAWAAAIAPSALDDYEPAIAAARRALELEPATRSTLLHLGGILYRAGEFDEALIHLASALTAGNPEAAQSASPLLLLAMTHHMQGHDADARPWYDRAVAETSRLLADGKPERGEPLPWIRRLTLELLRAEAGKLLDQPAEKAE